MTRLPALDGLRASAILIVMVSHAGLGQIVPGGLGVTIFFFLSGYLITTLMVTEWQTTNRLDFGGFYLRRAVRNIAPHVDRHQHHGCSGDPWCDATRRCIGHPDRPAVPHQLLPG